MNTAHGPYTKKSEALFSFIDKKQEYSKYARGIFEP
jgi:hypothetical protein